jgi:hypothetical protein
MRVEVARSLDLAANRFDIEPEITARLLRRGYRIEELPVRFDPRSRAQGKKIGWHDGVRALQVLLTERFRRHVPAPGRAGSSGETISSQRAGSIDPNREPEAARRQPPDSRKPTAESLK